MSEFNEWWRRTKKLLDEMDKLLDEMIRETFMEQRKGTRRVHGPYFYGFSVTVGPDGVPRIQEWGNIKPGITRPFVSEAIEPFTDIIDEEEKIKIICDMPGVEKEDINIEASEERVRISAKHGERNYFKIINLPVKVNPDTARAIYKNGVLTIIFQKQFKIRNKGKKIRVE